MGDEYFIKTHTRHKLLHLTVIRLRLTFTLLSMALTQSRVLTIPTP